VHSLAQIASVGKSLSDRLLAASGTLWRYDSDKLAAAVLELIEERGG
jgi:hypothetical protein